LSRETARRQSIMDAIYYESQGHKIDLKEISKSGTYGSIKAAVTPEELEDEMQRWRLGVKDDHDVIVDNYKRRIAVRIEQERHDQQMRIEASQRAAEASGWQEASLQPLMMGAAELRERFRKQHTAQVVYGTKANTLYERYIEHEAEPGTIVLRGGQPVSVPEGEAAPLQSQLERRMRAMRGGN